MLLIVTGFAILIGSIILLGLALGRNLSEGLQHPPLVVSSVVFSGLIIASVLLVSRASKELADRRLVWLGDFWMLATIPLLLDFLIDSFYGKPVIVILFALAGLLYWRGVKNNSPGFIVSIFTTALVAGDGLGHLKGEHCISTGLTGCPVKAVSDLYLEIIFLPLAYITITSRDKRPSLPVLVLTAFLAISLFVGFGLSG